MLLNFGRAKSPGKSGHEIGDGSPAPSGRSAATLGEPDLGTYVPRLIDTADGSLNSRYVKSFVEYSSAALLRPVLPAPSCECYLRR